MKFHWIALFCAAYLTLFVADVLAHVDSKTIILHPVADTGLFESAPDNNMGASSSLVLGANQQGKRGRLLVRFDLSGAIPTNAIILAAYLTVNAGATAANSANTSIQVHRFLQNWIEGVQSGMTGAPAIRGEPTWNSRSSPDIAWSQPGGSAGLDYSASPSASQTLMGPGTVAFDSTTNMVFDVQTWSHDASSNRGWMLISTSEGVSQSAVRINSKEGLQSPPELAVEYFMPDPEFRIEEAEKNGIYFLIHLNLEASNAYTLQFRENLEASPWQIATNFPPDASFRHYIWAESYTNVAHRFFRFGVTKPVTNP